MTYEEWRTANDGKFLKDPTLLEGGAFKETCTDEKVIDQVTNLVNQIYQHPDANLISTTMEFIEYLYEVYNLPSVDCEILGNLVITGMYHLVQQAAENVAYTLYYGAKKRESDEATNPNNPQNNRSGSCKIIDFPSNPSEE